MLSGFFRLAFLLYRARRQPRIGRELDRSGRATGGELFSIERGHIGLGDSVMPAELVFIEKTPGIAQGQ